MLDDENYSKTTSKKTDSANIIFVSLTVRLKHFRKLRRLERKNYITRIILEERVVFAFQILGRFR